MHAVQGHSYACPDEQGCELRRSGGFVASVRRLDQIEGALERVPSLLVCPTRRTHLVANPLVVIRATLIMTSSPLHLSRECVIRPAVFDPRASLSQILSDAIL